MKLTKERVAILVLSALLLLALVAGLVLFLQLSARHKAEKEEWEAEREKFVEATTGELVWRDGLWQYSNIYFTDFSVNLEKESVSFTMRNNYSKLFSSGLHPCLIQFRENGEWVTLPSSLKQLEKGVPEIAYIHTPFGDSTGSCEFPKEEQRQGEYRVIKRNGYYNDYNTYIFIVGYFNVP